MNMDKIKEFVKEHKEAVVGCAVLGVTYTIGYKMGANNEARTIARGLEKCIKVNPEIEIILWDAAEKLGASKV